MNGSRVFWLMLAFALGVLRPFCAYGSTILRCRIDVEERADSDLLTGPGSLLSERHDFYVGELLRRTPREMAIALGISARTVYSELGHLKLSLVDSLDRTTGPGSPSAFATRLAALGQPELMAGFRPEHSVLLQIRRLSELALSADRIAELVGLPVTIVRYVADCRKGGSRAWDRVMSYRGRLVAEEELVVILHDDGMTPSEIAAALNREATRLKLRAIQREEGEVRALLDTFLAFRPRVATTDAYVYYPGYSYLKAKRELDAGAVRRFVIDHYRRDDTWLAAQIGVSVSDLRGFYSSQQLYRAKRESGPFEAGPANPDRESINRYQLQRIVIESILDWIIANPGRLPIASDFGTAAGKIGVPYAKAREAFGEMEEMWLAVKERSLARLVPVRLLDLARVQSPDRLRDIWQLEAADLVVDCIDRNGGSVPGPDSFSADGTGDGVVPMDYLRFTGTGAYGIGRAGRNRAKRYFDSPETAWLFVKIRSRQRGVSCFPFLDTYFQGPTDLIRRQRQDEAPDRILDWMLAHGRYPQDGDHGTREGELAINAAQLHATGEYREGHVNHGGRIFESRDETQQRARARRTERALSSFVVDF